MGNIIRKLCDKALDHVDGEAIHVPAALGGHGGAAGVAALAHDLHHFEATGEVPPELSRHVQSSVTAQTNWYKKLLISWKKAKSPRNAEAASDLIVNTLRGHRKADVQGLLSYYGLSSSSSEPISEATPNQPWPEGVHYELISLPVASKDVADGDTLTIYVDVEKNTKQSVAPASVVQAFKKWKLAKKSQDVATAKALGKEISSAGYKAIDDEDEGCEILACRYRVRLRGVDAPEKSMPYGAEAKAMLVELVEGEQLQVLVYTDDQYGRSVADVHCKRGFVQEILLKKGCAWHYTSYDHRPDFTKWEQQAREKRVGLWKSTNPEEPWDYRKEHRKGS